MEPIISLIIPVYKAEPYLRQCLDSVIHQTYRNLEIICVNDESPDKSIDILKAYAARDNRVVIIDKKNEGVSAARNAALNAAKGQYILFVDADDWIAPETVQLGMEKLMETGSDVVMWPYFSVRGGNTVEKHFFEGDRVFEEDEVREKLHRRYVGLLGEELAHPELADSLCPVWGKIYKASVIRGIRFVDLNKIGTYEDGLFNLEVFFHVRKAHYIDHPMYYYLRSNTASQTAVYRGKLYVQWQSLFDYLASYIKTHRLSQNYEAALENRIALSIIGLGLNLCSSDMGRAEKIRHLQDILRTPRYREAYKKLTLRYFPLHWKVFFFLCKVGNASALYLLLQIIRRLK